MEEERCCVCLTGTIVVDFDGEHTDCGLRGGYRILTPGADLCFVREHRHNGVTRFVCPPCADRLEAVA